MAAGRPVPLVCRGTPPDAMPCRGCHKQGMAGRTACHRSRLRSLTLYGRYAPSGCPLTLRLQRTKLLNRSQQPVVRYISAERI